MSTYLPSLRATQRVPSRWRNLWLISWPKQSAFAWSTMDALNTSPIPVFFLSLSLSLFLVPGFGFPLFLHTHVLCLVLGPFLLATFCSYCHLLHISKSKPIPLQIPRPARCDAVRQDSLFMYVQWGKMSEGSN